MNRAVVVGGGSWGTGFSRLLLDRGFEVTLATRNAEDAAAINATGRNPRFLHEIELGGIVATTIAEAPIETADLVVVALPSRAFRAVVESLSGDAPLLSLTKGLDPATGSRLSTLVHGRPVAVMSGPNFAEEVAAGLPGAAVIASEDAVFASALQESLNSTVFRIYLNDDLIGVELCAAAKNVIALAAGACDGLEVGDNAKAALITRGLAEIARFGEAAGADADTFFGLAGMGDLVATCWHPTGRNRRAGELIARGRTPEQAVVEIGQVVEGIATAPVLRDLSHEIGVELPITESVCSVLEGRSLAELAAALMGRAPTDE